MTKTMKAAVVHGFGRPLTIDDIPIPDPGPGELLVKVIACGVCHTDLHAADGDWPVKPHVPFVPGHEVAGVVAALGPGVEDFKEGDPVGVAWLTIAACGANIARPAGRLSASVSAIQATASTVDSPNISSPPPTSLRGFTRALSSRTSRRSCVQG
jgi:Zn-dependent alcohol dehydrogenase